MTAILFLDIADSTALTTKLGDAAYRERERELDVALRKAIAEVGGTAVEGKVLGDGVMAVFASASQAIVAALRCRACGDDAELSLQAGIHAGDVVHEGNNVHGGAVQLASRVQSVAAPGEILGDGVMAVFASASQAIVAALRCRSCGDEAELSLHAGIHAGDVVHEGNNVHGGAVQLASRVQSVAAPGEILVSDIVRGLARTSAGVSFEDRGEHVLKGIGEPQRLFAVIELG